MITIVLTIIEVLLFIAALVATPIGVALLCRRAWRRLLSTMTSPVTDNRILYWPVALAVVWPLLFALLWLFFQTSSWWENISVYFVTIDLISLYASVVICLGLAAIWIGSVVVACRLMIQWATARQWRTVLSTLILPLTFSIALLSTPFLWRVSATAGSYMAFFGEYPLYVAHLEKRPATGPRFMIWVSGPYDASAVLYDETDEIASDHPSEAWKKKAEAEGVVCCKHQHIMGHYYWVEVDLDAPH